MDQGNCSEIGPQIDRMTREGLPLINNKWLERDERKVVVIYKNSIFTHMLKNPSVVVIIH